MITSTGAVTKRAFTFDEPLDPGLADWAAATSTSVSMAPTWARSRSSAGSTPRSCRRPERAFVETLAPAFRELADTLEDTLYVDGAARLLRRPKFDDLDHVNDLMRMLERRMTLLSVLRSALGERTVFLRIGHENQAPELHAASVVAASYGLGHRTLGTVSVIGPVRMDYRQAISSVRVGGARAEQLRRAGLRVTPHDCTDAARLLRGAGRLPLGRTTTRSRRRSASSRGAAP